MDNILNEIKNNINIPNRCYNTAEKSDIIFQKIAISNNMIIKKSSYNTDIFDHIDYYMTYNNKSFTVDIKSAKKFMEFNHSNGSILDEWIWVELKNVNGKNGWLYGKADYVVYVFLKELWFINRKRLINFINQKLIKEYVTDKKFAQYKLYKRLNRNDLLTLINLKDLKIALNPAIII